ncbi:hypothetical protein [Tepidibacter formicigenes]|jgi:flagella basal body P-ring formation protein FlgA|uniref:Uncharacterized protein n=1 Tax=Tepidibacter formicigenes DSM 15518 TaxID=1123349 RepID=A0A1M6NKC0_9FIRM|nr:hypothetical protein [Tepidibacter formicigenes]SHJ96161.1 hypothetical protein SAMN02744037_01292 [Tepidibacter formicigenes DSM 15518]
MKKLGASLIICSLLASNNVLAFADTNSTNTVNKKIEQKQTVQKQESKNTSTEKKDSEKEITDKKQTEKKEESKKALIEIIKPDSDYTVTTNDKIVISGKGQEGSSVSVEVYSKKDETYERTQAKKLEIGAIGLFVTEVKLSPGENKIVVKNEEDKKVKIVLYKKIENKQDIQKDMDELKDKGIKDMFKDIISSVK